MNHPFPLFIIALSLLLGLGTSQCILPFFGLPILFYITRSSHTLITLSSLFFCFGVFQGLTLNKELPQEGALLQGIAQIEKIKKISSPFGASFRFEARLCDAKKVPLHLCWVMGEGVALPQNDFVWIEGRYGYHDGRYMHLSKLNGVANIPFTSQHHARRLLWKEKAEKKISSIRSFDLAHALLSSLISGYCDNRYLLFLLNKSGLQHMIAISGYHLQLLSTFITTFFLISMRRIKPAIYGALSLVILYLLFLGPSPPVNRAFIMLCIASVGRLLGYPIHPMNGLGAAMGFELIKDPLAFMDMGAELSYIATVAIILCYPQSDLSLKKLFNHHLPIPSYSPFIRKLLRFFAIGIRKILALNITIHLWTFPLLLYHLKSLSLLTFFYTLYIVPLIGLSLTLLLIFFLLPWESLLHLNALFTQSYLCFIEAFPRWIDLTIHQDNIHPQWICVALFSALCYSIRDSVCKIDSLIECKQ